MSHERNKESTNTLYKRKQGNVTLNCAFTTSLPFQSGTLFRIKGKAIVLFVFDLSYISEPQDVKQMYCPRSPGHSVTFGKYCLSQLAYH